MLKAVRHRPGQALVVLLLAALVTAAAGFTALYDRALQQAQVRVLLAHEPLAVSGLSLQSMTDVSGNVVDHAGLVALVPPGVRRSFRAPIDSTEVAFFADRLTGPRTATAPLVTVKQVVGSLIWRAHMCVDVQMASGRCPTRVGEVAVSQADEHNYGLRTGDRVAVGESVPTQAQSAPKPAGRAALTVVGVYRKPPVDYSFTTVLTGRSGTLPEGSNTPLFDRWLTSQATITSPVLHWKAPVTEVDLPLATDRVGVDQMLRLGPAVARFVQRPVRPTGFDDVPPPVTAFSGLATIAASVAHARRQAAVTVPLLMVQLGLLAVVVLWLVLGTATEQRRGEVAVARLRGQGSAGGRRLLLGELGPVVLAGVPVGVAAALATGAVARHSWLPLDPPFEVPRAFWLGVAGSAVGLALLLVAAVQRVAREPLTGLLRRVPVRRAGWAVGVLDAVVIAVSATAVVAFAAGDLHGPIALAAPALLALLVGLLLAHLVPPAAARAGRRLLARGRVGAGVGLLQVARRPATRRLLVIATVAVALLTFSTDALAVGHRNRVYAAQQQAGSPLVLELLRSDLLPVQAALRSVDARGTRTTLVTRLRSPGEGAATTVAVDPDRFARIALFPGQSAASLHFDRLAAPAVAPVRVVGSGLAVRLSARFDDGEAVTLAARMLGPDGVGYLAPLGRVPGTGPPRVHRAPVPCARGCVLTGWSVGGGRTGGSPVEGRLDIAPATGATGRVRLGPPGNWPAVTGSTGSLTPVTGAAGAAGRLSVAFRLESSEPVVLGHAYVPRRLPALVAGRLPTGSSPPRFAGLDLDGVQRSMVEVGSLARVPAAPQDTNVVNLAVLRRDGAVPQGIATEVWLARDDPTLLRRVQTALQQRGQVVSATRTVTGFRRASDETAAVWSLQLGVLVGVGALALGVLMLVLLAAASRRPQARDLAALRLAGLPAPTALVTAVAEQLPAVLLAVVAGVACGVAGAHLALPTVPLFASAPEVSTLDLTTAWGTVLLAALVALAVLTTVAWGLAVALSRRATLDRVRDTL